jgi:hypothetical protein
MRGLNGLALLLSSVRPAAPADIPAVVAACLAKAGPAHVAHRKLDRYALRGDFDGDGKPDQAVVVTRNRQQGVIVCRGRGDLLAVLGAGAAFHEMTNLDFTGWRVHPRQQRVARGFGARRPPALAGDALLLEWESASGLVYWNGKRFVWYQQGD